MRFKAPVYAHNSESAGEVAQCLELNGRTPTAYLDSLGLFAYGGGGFHCVHMTQEDLEIFRDRRLSAITNPSSNLKLASGIAPIKAMMDMGSEHCNRNRWTGQQQLSGYVSGDVFDHGTGKAQRTGCFSSGRRESAAHGYCGRCKGYGVDGL